MKFISLLFIISVISFSASPAQTMADNTDTVTAIPEFKSLYCFQNFYLSGQPTYEMFCWLKDHGTRIAVNLRSEKEIVDFTAASFNEEKLLGELGIRYHAVPVDGHRDYTPEKLNAMAELLNRQDTILIHCASAGRVTDFFMAYLIKYQGYTIDEAVAVGKSLKFSLPLEKLLGSEIGFVIKD